MSTLSDFIKSRRNQKEQAKNTEKEKRSKDWLSWIPVIALVVGNLIVLAGELRVFDVVFKLTNSYLLASTALLGTGLMFILWFDILHQYRLRTETQGKISLVFSVLSLLMGGFFAFADYAVNTSSQTVLGLSINWLWGTVVIVTVANAIALFWWHEIDPRVDFERASAENEAADLQEEKEYEGYERSLARRESLLGKHESIKATYGEDALNETIEEHGKRKNAKVSKPQKQNQQAPQLANQLASETKREELAVSKPTNPTQAERKN